jgi:hypothetical protein
VSGGMSAIGTKQTWRLHCTCPLLTQSGHLTQCGYCGDGRVLACL